ncbi:RimK family alpha-L-glutamate ligase [Bradyrhizobium sp. STM 3557]|uniref:ATP-grasp domain-containing protein n=1 Tax=Bradyrhizobium sp. STM 3557 TaxID=578920 RepID=UPI00388F14AF
MINGQRLLVEIIKRYCSERGIALDIRADGWLLVLDRGGRRRRVLGYDLGLNSSVAHRIACDKSATAELLALSGIACVPHAFFLGPQPGPRAPLAPMLRLLDAHPEGLVIKPNEGTSGRLVFRATTREGLARAVDAIFAANMNLAIAPYLSIDEEVRVVLLDGAPQTVYAKQRIAVVGNGRQTFRELALAATPRERHVELIDNLRSETDDSDLDAIVPSGTQRLLNWRHNLEFGAEATLLKDGESRDACVALAIAAADALGIRFASVDLVRAHDRWQVLEINSGVVMEQLGRRHPELVDAIYTAALDRVFEGAT